MDLSSITRFAAEGILNSLLAGIVIALFAWTVTVMVRRQGSGTRFAVWFLALVALAFVPVAGHIAVRSGNRADPVEALILPAWFATFLFVGWAIGAGLGLLHVAHGLYRLRRLRGTCKAIELSQLDPVLPNTLDQLRTRRTVTLCTSDAVRVPAAIGYFHPIVVFPSWALAEIPPAELNAILLHELAHLQRWDDWTNLAQKILKAVFFFHPAVWFIESRLTLEREMACDDAVLAANFNARAYAESLVGLAEKSFLRRGIQLAQAAFSHVEQLRLRLAEILRKDKPEHGSGFGKPAVALMSLAAIVLVYGAAQAPRLVAFSNDTAPQMASSTSRAVLGTSDFHLQPMSVNYAVQPQAGTAPARKLAPAQLRMTHQTTKTLRALVARHFDETRVANELAPPPVMALANFPIDLNSTATPVLVVFQGTQFGPDGPIFWRVTVVHLTPAQHRGITGGIPKQI